MVKDDAMTSKSLWTMGNTGYGEIYRFIYFIKNNNIPSSIHNCHTLDLIRLPGRGSGRKKRQNFFFIS